MEKDSGEEGVTGASAYGRFGTAQDEGTAYSLCYELPKVPGLRRVIGVRPGKKRRFLLDSSMSLVEDEDRMSDDGGEKEQALSTPTAPAAETAVLYGPDEFEDVEISSDEDMQDGDGLRGRCVGHEAPEYASFWRGTQAELSDLATQWATKLANEPLCDSYGRIGD